MHTPPPHRSNRGFARWIWIAGTAAILLLIIWMAVYWSAENTVRRQQAALLKGIEKRSASRISRLVDEKYKDRWSFTREDAVNAMLDAGSQFLVLTVKPSEESLEKKDGKIIYTSRLAISGKGIGPGATAVMRQLNSLKAPFTFTWEKQGFLPAGWRLIEMDNPDIPDEIYGYTPGDLRRMMQGDF